MIYKLKEIFIFVLFFVFYSKNKKKYFFVCMLNKVYRREERKKSKKYDKIKTIRFAIYISILYIFQKLIFFQINLYTYNMKENAK